MIDAMVEVHTSIEGATNSVLRSSWNFIKKETTELNV